MYEAVLTSCKNLGTFSDIYFVHQVDEEHEEEGFQRGGALDALTELKNEGKIHFTGVASHYYSTLLRAAADIRVDASPYSGTIAVSYKLQPREYAYSITCIAVFSSRL